MRNYLFKAIHFTDPHVRGTNPKYRKDFFPDTIKEKLVEVGKLAKSLDVSMVTCGGDMYDIPDVANTIMCELGDTLHPYFSRRINLYGVIGNHDEFGMNPETLDRTGLGVLAANGLYNVIPPEGINFKVYDSKDKSYNILILGVNSTMSLDHGVDDYIGTRKYPYNGNLYDADYVIMVVHGFITDKKWPDGVPYTLIDDIVKVTKCDMILTGHEHTGFGVIKRGGVTFCNPGALGRLSASVGEINRDVNVALVELFEEDGKIDGDIRLVPIQCAKPSEEILDREELEKEKQKQANINNVITQLTDFRIKSINPLDIIQEVARLERENGIEFDDAVVQETVKRLSKSQEELALKR